MQSVIDVCCGSRMFWENKSDERAVFCDIRREEHILCDGRTLTIDPEHMCDFRCLPFDDDTFRMAVFDPPHLVRVGETSWMGKKYGRLNRDTWQEDIAAGFREAFRVIKPGATLIFKWNETQVPVAKVIELSPYAPLIRQRVGKNDKTHWIVFIKPEVQGDM